FTPLSFTISCCEIPFLSRNLPKRERDLPSPNIISSPFFIEVQKSVYSKKVMQDKINRYELYFHSQECHNESWQPKGSKFFPSILIITDKQYDINSSNLRIFQASSISDFMASLAVKAE
ncbi:hypothetical protein P7D13_28705, partial [Bacillus toyonensis]|nr:hypothetical protein [Bacillus toyonensis]